MIYCVSAGCQRPQNPSDQRFCLCCGQALLLKDRYRPVKPIGKGGMGRTFLAVDEHIPSKPKCVIKQLCFPQQDSTSFRKVVSLFRQEAIHLNELGKHPQIPSLFAHFEQQQQLYLVQELISGQTLAEELQQRDIYNETQIWEFLEDLLPVLQYIHEHRVIHRDIKPANIIRRTPSTSPSPGEKEGQLILIDFGIAKLFTDTAVFNTGTIVGSPDYMAPEQTRGKALPSSDLYSLGVTCIYLLTSVSPLNMYDIMNNGWAWRDFLPKERKVSDRLGQILDRLLQNNIKDRYPDAASALKAVQQNLNPRPTSPVPTQSQRPGGSALNSEVGVDYTKLRDLLAKKKWKEADRETWAVMCLVVGKSSNNYLFNSDIQKFPCEDLWTIDQLWVKYSQGRFGFSVQKQIFLEVGGEYSNFCDRVGWPTHNPYIPDSGLKFSDKAPIGHLPSRRWAGGYEWWRHASAMAGKLEQCSIA
ncbi:serine/threonine-protein kinase [Coleofasciculus sp. FACHB-T130]|uniref:serine/threonine-protein kinase n=1 Tax=Cyanophyceae TaxID=3028117 RepID=UPI001687EE78|nr:serine/threonine-protein kinase [Coleofasciculus sp. FACHB-T130]MBD1881718.1 GUN4 domain-containing protein [Coleofasciculus sp. FACHB-T130]